MTDIQVDDDGVWHVPVRHEDLLKVADSIARDLEACMAKHNDLQRRIDNAMTAYAQCGQYQISADVTVEEMAKCLREERGDEA